MEISETTLRLLFCKISGAYPYSYKKNYKINKAMCSVGNRHENCSPKPRQRVEKKKKRNSIVGVSISKRHVVLVVNYLPREDPGCGERFWPPPSRSLRPPSRTPPRAPPTRAEPPA
jgi:hypothetical protein